MTDTLSRLVDVSIVAVIASILAQMSLAALLIYTRSGLRAVDRRGAVLLSLAHVCFLGATLGLSLNAVIPFWIEATLVIAGIHAGLIAAFLAMSLLLWRRVAWCVWVGVGLAVTIGQALLANLSGDVAVLFVTSSVANAAICLWFFAQLWRKASREEVEARPFIAVPFLAVAVAYAVRLWVVLAVQNPPLVVIATVAIAFVLATSCMLWVMAIVMLRGHRLDRTLEATAMRDPLTGLENGRALAALDDAWPSRAWRRRGSRIVAIRVDVDGIAGAGHDMTEEVSQQLLQVLAARMDEVSGGLQDRAFRIHERAGAFLLWHELDPGDDAERHIDIVKRRLGRPMEFLGERVVPKLSLGSYTTTLVEPLGTIVKRAERRVVDVVADRRHGDPLPVLDSPKAA